jgi:Glycosyltransferase family 87
VTRKTSLFLPTLVAVAAHVVLFVATGLLIKYGTHPDLGAASWSYRIYYDYASQAIQGQVPYRDYLVEYPILALPLFLVPRLFVSDFARYCIVFAAEMLLFDVAAIVLIARHVAENEGAARVAGRLAWYSVYCASLAPLVVGRFELAPMVFAFAAARWWLSGRNVLGGFTAGLGALLKVFPGLVAVPAMVWELTRLRTSRASGTVAFLVTLAIGGAGWFLLGGSNVLDSFRYHTARGLGIESLYSGALLAWGKLAGLDVPWVIEHKAVHLVPEWGSRLAALASPLQAVALLLVMIQFRRRGMADGVRYAGAAILACLVTAKVLSPQYLVWLFPFIGALGGWTGSRARWLFLFICLTTALIYPGPAFAQILDHQAPAIFLLNVRNLLILALLSLVLFGPTAGVLSVTGSQPVGLAQTL